jgi:hypothetical protein
MSQSPIDVDTKPSVSERSSPGVASSDGVSDTELVETPMEVEESPRVLASTAHASESTPMEVEGASVFTSPELIPLDSERHIQATSLRESSVSDGSVRSNPFKSFDDDPFPQ